MPTATADPVISATARAEATRWFENVWSPVKESPQEFKAQAFNAAVRTGAQFGMTQRGSERATEQARGWSVAGGLHPEHDVEDAKIGPIDHPSRVLL